MMTWLLGICLLAGAAACDKSEIYLGSADAGTIQSPDGNVVYVTDGGGRGDTGFVEYKDSYSFPLYLRSSKEAEGTVSATFTYDPEVLKEYNAMQGTDYAIFPEKFVSLADNGKTSIASGALTSAPLYANFSSDSSLNPEEIYAVPLRVTAEGGVLSAGSDSYIILVRDVTAFPGSDKYFEGKPGMKTVAVIEVNSVNPLNTIGFTEKRSGKQFFDAVVLFSANINFDSATGRVYVSRNENVQALLDQRDKYLRPLQQRGIKVILGILGNHDISGISTLAPDVAHQFAQEVKAVCDAYDLDGVFLDDEYTKYQDAASGRYPGFVAQSTTAASRLAYEIRKAQPERLLMAYRYEALDRGVEIDCMNCGEIWDYVFNNYWVTSNPVPSFPGLRQDQAGTGSWSCTNDSQCIPSNRNWKERFSLTGMREAGYGALMIYNFHCDPSDFLTPYIISDMNETSKAFWDDELVYDGSWYTKDY